MSFLLVLGLAVVYLASSLGTLAHFLVVEHVRCLEHGEWLHASELSAHLRGHQAQTARAGDRSEGRLAWAGSQRPSVVQSDGDETPARHEHCGQTVEIRTHHDLGREVTLPSLGAARVLVASVAVPRQLLRVLPVYAYAPKTSPPDVLVTIEV